MSDCSGIDLGTSQTKVAYVDANGKPCIVPNARGEERTPTVVHVPEQGDVLVGNDAVEQGYLEPQRCARGFKLQLGTTHSLFDDGPPFTATDAASEVVKQTTMDIERATGRACRRCTITCPANFLDDQKDALIEAFARHGIEVLKVIPEPTAAAIAYAADKMVGQSTIAVFDFGGGTLDVSIVKVDRGQLTVLATDGVPKLGGNDIDERIRQRVLAVIESEHGVRPTREDDPLFFQDLDPRVTMAKVSLNTRERVAIVTNPQSGQVITEITREQFHEDIDPLIQQAIQPLDNAVAAAGLTYEQIDQLIMVGGSSRLLRVQEQLADHTGLAPRNDIDPEKAVAYGAALACVAELADRGETAEIRGQAIPAPNLFVQDVTGHGVGCCVIDSARSDRQLINSVIIPRNKPIPCHRSDCFSLAEVGQTQATIEILQGDPDAARDDCLVIGKLELTDLPPEDKATSRIKVEYMIDANGMVTATATDLVGGQSRTVSVDYKKGIQPKAEPAAA